MREVAILGGHGDGLVAAQILRDMQRAGSPVRLVGFLNDAVPVGGDIAGIPVLETTANWSKLEYAVSFHVCLHKVGKMTERVALTEAFAIPEERLVTLIHPSACIAEGVSVGAGSLVASHVTCQPGATIGRHVSVRAGASLGHDVRLDSFSYVGPNATLCGRARLGQGSHAGPNSVVTDGVVLGAYSVLGAGAVALRDTDEKSVWLGNPARKVR